MEKHCVEDIDERSFARLSPSFFSRPLSYRKSGEGREREREEREERVGQREEKIEMGIRG